jgi:hypothetical protein
MGQKGVQLLEWGLGELCSPNQFPAKLGHKVKGDHADQQAPGEWQSLPFSAAVEVEVGTSRPGG